MAQRGRLAWLLLASLVLAASRTATGLNFAPSFTADMNQHTLRENTPIGTVVYTLAGKDPEGSPVTFGIKGKVAETYQEYQTQLSKERFLPFHENGLADTIQITSFEKS